MGDYLVSFSAVAAEPLQGDVAARLAGALAATPGTGAVDSATQDDQRRLVVGRFTISVVHGIADAARDASRLAKEALNGAGLPDAQLVELALTLRYDDDPAEGEPQLA
jgi:hypothetical protein